MIREKVIKAGCQLCHLPFFNNVIYDAKTIHGPWAYMCEHCFKASGKGLGTGLGQKYSINPLKKLEG